MAVASFVSVGQSLLYIPDDAQATSARVGFLLPANFPNPPQSITLEDSLLKYAQGVYLFFTALPYDATNPGLLTSFIQAVYTYLDDLLLPGVRFVWLTNPQDFSDGLIGTPIQVTMQGNYAVTRRATALQLAPNINLRISGGTQIAADPDGTNLVGTATAAAPLAVIVTPQGSQPQTELPLQNNTLTIAMTGSSVSEGCLGLSLSVDSDGLTALDTGLRYFTPDLNPDTPGYIQSFRYPLFNPAPGSMVALTAMLDPLAPLEATRTYFGFRAGQSIPSFFSSVLDSPVTLEPQSSAQLVFTVKPTAQTSLSSGGDVVSEPYYLTPQGDFNLTITDARAQRSEGPPDLLNCLACGFSGIEYFSLPQGSGTITFRAGQPAFCPSQVRSSDAASSEQTVLYQGLTDAATTSWAYIHAREPMTSYYAQPDDSIWHQAHVTGSTVPPAFLTYLPVLAGSLPDTLSSAQVFPVVPYKGITADPLVTTLEPFAQLEKQVLNPARRNLIYEINPQFSRQSSPADQGNGQGTTPQGFLLTLEATRWASLLLAQTTDPAQNVVRLQLNNVRGPLQAALQANQLFMVVSSPTRFQANSDIPAYKITVQAKTDLIQSQDPVVPQAIIDAVWNSMNNVLYPSLADFQNALKPILGADYTTYVGIITQVAAVFTIYIQQWAFDLSPYFWSNFHTILIFKFTNNRLQDLVQDSSSWVQGQALNDDIPSTQQQLQAFVADALADESPEMDYFKTTVLSDPSWNGMLALRCRIPLSALPAQVEGLAAGINVNQFFAHHVGITVTPISASNGNFAVNDSSLFGLIRYSDESGDATDQSADYDFKVLNLSVLFENSGVGRFSSQIALLINKLFMEPATLKSSGASGSITLNGVYQQHNDQGSYVFTTQDETVFQVNSQVLDSVEINKAEFLTLIPPAGLPTGANVQTRFVLWGNLRFKALSGFDLFSFGSADNASGGLSYAHLAIDMEFPPDLPTHKTFTFDAEQVTFDISTSVARPESFYNHFPLKLSGLVQAGQEITPANLGYMPVNTPLTGSQLTPPWYGLQYELNLGSPGALASQAGFVASLLTAWAPNPRNYTIFIGLRMPGVNGGKREISLEGIIKITFGDVRIVVNASSYILQLRNIALSLLSLSFPPGQTDMILFGNPNEQDNTTLGWYAAYKKANQGSPQQARQIRAPHRHESK